MPEKGQSKSLRRSSLARSFVALGQSKKGLPAGLTWLRIVVGAFLALGVSLLVTEYDFHTLPSYEVGSIADRNVEAFQDFQVIDEEATAAAEAEALGKVGEVFEFDYQINTFLESDLRNAMAACRSTVEAEKERLRIAPDRALPVRARAGLQTQIEEMFPQLGSGPALDIFLKYSCAVDLENELVEILSAAMRHPGVVANREQLLQYQEHGLLLINSVTGEISLDWVNVRDLEEARAMVRSRDSDLTKLADDEKAVLVEFLANWIRPNVYRSEDEKRSLEQQALATVNPVVIQVKKGRTIIRAGDEVTQRQVAQLEALRRVTTPGGFGSRLAGTFIVVAFFFFTLWQYFTLRKEDTRKRRARYLLLVLVLVLSLLLTKVFFLLGDLISFNLSVPDLQEPSHFYLFAPLAMGSMLTVLLGAINSALLFALMFSVCIGLLTGDMAVFLYALTGSLTAIYALRTYRERSALVRAGVATGLVNAMIALALQLYATGMVIEWQVTVLRASGGLVSGLAAAMLTALFLPVLESMFGLTTDIRLLELSSLNSPILRRLAVEAPGTYHHSIILGTLAEAAAEAISANALLVRVSAYYHDIGKLKHPEYYIENQIYANNKHDSLSPTMSSLILASHVKDGLAIAEEIGLPPQVTDMIPQHHGTRLMTYFYQKAKEAAAETKCPEVSEADFRYPGPKPQTREAAILMLADQVEAAARTLQDPSPGHIRGLINRLFRANIQDGQFDECDVTLKDLGKVASTFERVLTGMYHHRIEYPGFKLEPQIEPQRSADQRIQ